MAGNCHLKDYQNNDMIVPHGIEFVTVLHCVCPSRDEQ